MAPVLLNNRYQILESLARGGFGETFLAIDTYMPSGRRCVIKKLQPLVQSSQIPDWLKERFQREAAILEDLGENNPQIPQLYAYFTQAGQFYLVQEWIEGLTLTQKHQAEGNFSEEQVRELLGQLLPVLDYIHDRRIIHRDIKPDNIILRKKDNLPILIDFGVVKETVATVMQPDGKTAYSIALGTPGYMSSEQAAGRPVYSSDLYSLGLTMIFLLTGKPPQELETDSRTGEILMPQEAKSISATLANILEKAISFHPRDRFGSAREMIIALNGTNVPAIPTSATLVVSPGLEQTPQPATKKAKIVSKPKKSGINIWQWLLSLLLLAGATVGGFMLGFKTFLPKESPRPEPSPRENEEIFQPLPSPNPSPRPRRTPRPEPVYTPTPSPSPSPEASPSPNPSPSPEVSPSPSPEVSPSPTPTPSPEASPTPEASPSPNPPSVPIPVETPSPTPNPEVSPAPIPVEPAPEVSPSPATVPQP